MDANEIAEAIDLELTTNEEVEEIMEVPAPEKNRWLNYCERLADEFQTNRQILMKMFLENISDKSQQEIRAVLGDSYLDVVRSNKVEVYWKAVIDSHIGEANTSARVRRGARRELENLKQGTLPKHVFDKMYTQLEDNLTQVDQSFDRDSEDNFYRYTEAIDQVENAHFLSKFHNDMELEEPEWFRPRTKAKLSQLFLKYKAPDAFSNTKVKVSHKTTFATNSQPAKKQKHQQDNARVANNAQKQPYCKIHGYCDHYTNQCLPMETVQRLVDAEKARLEAMKKTHAIIIHECDKAICATTKINSKRDIIMLDTCSQIHIFNATHPDLSNIRDAEEPLEVTGINGKVTYVHQVADYKKEIVYCSKWVSANVLSFALLREKYFLNYE